MFSFDLQHVQDGGRARAATFHTPHGPLNTPAFMPVGTLGAVKGVTADQLRDTHAQMVLANTYHLALRPGDEIVAELGGLHRFMDWSGPILTDSGGFQIFSLAQMTKISEQGAVFRSHLDGSLVELSPERSMEIQERLGADVAMVLDHVVALPCPPEVLNDAVERTLRWAIRCRDAHRRSDQALFAIVQGGLDVGLRLRCTEALCQLDLPGYAIGGLSVGEAPEQMHDVVRETAEALPAAKPRYLMGVGRPQDVLEAIRWGVDMMDCVLPTRNGRNAWAFTDRGWIRLRNQKYQKDLRPLEEDCPCPACRHSRGYLRHLFQANEMLGPILVSIHNLTFYQRLVRGARQAILADQFENYRAEKLAAWTQGDASEAAAAEG